MKNLLLTILFIGMFVGGAIININQDNKYSELKLKLLECEEKPPVVVHDTIIKTVYLAAPITDHTLGTIYGSGYTIGYTAGADDIFAGHYLTGDQINYKCDKSTEWYVRRINH